LRERERKREREKGIDISKRGSVGGCEKVRESVG
jgi:hypothetical protein